MFVGYPALFGPIWMPTNTGSPLRITRSATAWFWLFIAEWISRAASAGEVTG